MLKPGSMIVEAVIGFLTGHVMPEAMEGGTNRAGGGW
jgi:hypothetical protein